MTTAETSHHLERARAALNGSDCSVSRQIAVSSMSVPSLRMACNCLLYPLSCFLRCHTMTQDFPEQGPEWEKVKGWSDVFTVTKRMLLRLLCLVMAIASLEKIEKDGKFTDATVPTCVFFASSCTMVTIYACKSFFGRGVNSAPDGDVLRWRLTVAHAKHQQDSLLMWCLNRYVTSRFDKHRSLLQSAAWQIAIRMGQSVAEKARSGRHPPKQTFANAAHHLGDVLRHFSGGGNGMGGGQRVAN